MDTAHVIATREALERLQEGWVVRVQLSQREPLEAGAELETDMKLTDVISRPLITEKTTLAREATGRWCSRWRRRARKSTSSGRSRSCSASKVEGVRTRISHGKIKRQGRFVGQRPDWKKAYVKLREGEKMPEFLEGALSIMPHSQDHNAYSNTTRHRRAGASRPCRRSTRSRRPSRTSRSSSRCSGPAAATTTAS